MKYPNSPLPTHGEWRDIEGFLYLPRRISYQWRWLEYAYWVERYYYGQWHKMYWSTKRVAL